MENPQSSESKSAQKIDPEKPKDVLSPPAAAAAAAAQPKQLQTAQPQARTTMTTTTANSSPISKPPPQMQTLNLPATPVNATPPGMPQQQPFTPTPQANRQPAMIAKHLTNATPANRYMKAAPTPVAQATPTQPPAKVYSAKPTGQPSNIKQPMRPHPIAPKYMKIQPAIAPKPAGGAAPQTSRFNPIPDGKLSISIKSASHGGADTKSLNTSKKWVLPPRPRPGRKPTAGECDKISKTQPNPVKRKPKVEPTTGAIATNTLKNEQPPKKVASAPQLPSPSVAMAMAKQQPMGVTDTKISAPAQNADISPKRIPLLPDSSPVSQSSLPAAASASASASASEPKKLVVVPTMHQTTSASVPVATTSLPPPPSSNTINTHNTANIPNLSNLSKPFNPSNATITVPKPQTPQTLKKLPTPPPPAKPVDPAAHMTELKISYLSKLKEQELMRNYIEVLTNQIKELSFVQNGVITFDALKNNAKYNQNGMTNKRLTTTMTNSKIDQLDSINNLNDLNKFLGYLSKSSDIIRNAQKQTTAGTTTGATVNPPETINHQIEHYVKLRNRFTEMNNKRIKTPGSRKLAGKTCNKENDESSSSSFQHSASPSSVKSPTTSFTPDLLHPLKASNLFNDPTIDYDMELQTATIAESPTSLRNSTSSKSTDRNIGIIPESSPNMGMDFFVDEHDFLNRLVLNDDYDVADMRKEELELGSVEIHGANSMGVQEGALNDGTGVVPESQVDIRQMNGGNSDSLIRKKFKFNCGFCTKDTPCLCFDSDWELHGFK
ncbi:uncharacterized protein LODBEIA_P01880 [Lodderomyces beijingensis]|uniref:Hap4 transcription factor heteromerisation domain-containing protein n=1 Tax=Lodderomyces beijingensis TaxID=1775926 RepID=A0ABP0ZCQ6_9ASCO